MTIDTSKAKIFKALLACASTEAVRPALTGVYVKDGIGYGSDGFILAKMRIDTQGEGIIPAELIKQSNTDLAEINDTGEVTMPGKTDSVTMPLVSGEFPEVEHLVTKWQETASASGVTVGLGLGVLESLVKSMKLAQVVSIKLEIPLDNRDCIVATSMEGTRPDKDQRDIQYYLMPFFI